MATPGYVVRGKGEPASLDSASHGAGRRMSRTRAKQEFTWADARRVLEERGVTLLSAGLDEVPMAYKDIDAVMAAQADLVDTSPASIRGWSRWRPPASRRRTDAFGNAGDAQAGQATLGGSRYRVMANTAYTISISTPTNHAERPPLVACAAVMVATSTITTAPGQKLRSIGAGPST